MILTELEICQVLMEVGFQSLVILLNAKTRKRKGIKEVVTGIK